MQTDHKLQLTVLEHLDYDPSVNASHIGVTVREGIVVLTGHVPSLGEKRAAEAVAGLVQGVKAVVNEIAIDWPGKCLTLDEVIAERVHARLSTNRSVPIERIHAIVEDGIVTLRGDVDWHYQREAVENDLHPLEGIRELHNEIKIKPPIKVAAVRKRVRDALSSISPLDAAQVVVKTKGSCVQLSGSVNSWHEKGIAERVARAVPGVSQVENHIIVP